MFWANVSHRRIPLPWRRALHAAFALLVLLAISGCASPSAHNGSVSSGPLTTAGSRPIPSVSTSTTSVSTPALSVGPAPITTLGALDCVTVTRCVAVGTTDGTLNHTAITATSGDGGSSWVGLTLPITSSGLSGLSCPSSTSCVAVGGALAGPNEVGRVLTTTDGGTQWTPRPLPSIAGQLNAVSCPNTSLCIAVGQLTSGAALAIASTDGGMKWTPESLPVRTQALRSISCPTTQSCVAAGFSGAGPNIVTTQDAGATWLASISSSALGGPLAIDCPSVTRCLIVGSTGSADANPTGAAMTSTDSGHSWVNEVLPPATPYLTGIACLPAGQCIAVGGGIEPRGGPGTGAILTTTDEGASWIVRAVPPGMGAVTALSCPSAATCVAVGSDPGATVPWVAVSADGGVFWTGQTLQN